MGKLIEKIVEEFKNKEYKKRSAEGIAEALEEDVNIVRYILENSDMFEKVEGKKKTYYVLKEKTPDDYEIVNLKIKKKKGISLSSAIEYIAEQGFEVIESETVEEESQN